MESRSQFSTKTLPVYFQFLKINAVRLAINMIIGSEEDVSNWTNDPRNLRSLQHNACNKLLNLFLRNRDRLKPECARYPYRWNQVNFD